MTSDLADDAVRRLDARKIEGEPFSEIMVALDALPEGGTLVLVNSFEPRPLYNVLEHRGFEYEVARVSDDEWHLSITHS